MMTRLNLANSRSQRRLRRSEDALSETEPSARYEQPGASIPEGPRVGMRHGKLVRFKHHAEAHQAPAEGLNVVGPVAASLGRVRTSLIIIFVVSISLPFSWPLGPLRMPPYLLFLILGFVPCLFLWAGRRKVPIILPDILMILFNFWGAVCLMRSAPLSETLEPIGVHVLTTTGAFLTGRLLVRDMASMLVMVKTSVVTLVVTLPALAIESVTNQKLILRLAGLFGDAVPAVDIGKRLGLHRVQGGFEHPILLGIFCASMLGLGAYTFRKSGNALLRYIAAPTAFVGSLLSLSTGALLSLNVQLGLMLWSRVFRNVNRKWLALTVLLIVSYLVIDVLSSKSPFHVFVNRATFSSTSSYNRILIWQYGTESVSNNPLFGIGLSEWQRASFMSSSMDNFWLFQAVRYGVPGFVLLTGAIVLVLVRVGRAKLQTAELINLRRGIMCSVIGTSVAIGSVHIWNASYVWFVFLIGAIAWLGVSDTSDGRLATSISRHR